MSDKRGQRSVRIPQSLRMFKMSTLISFNRSLQSLLKLLQLGRSVPEEGCFRSLTEFPSVRRLSMDNAFGGPQTLPPDTV